MPHAWAVDRKRLFWLAWIILAAGLSLSCHAEGLFVREIYPILFALMLCFVVLMFRNSKGPR